jgi:alpha-D-ribose 1-methylphosphonate 5-phosphate C-P lyase
MIAECATEPRVFFYPEKAQEKKLDKYRQVGNVSIELYFDIFSMMSRIIKARSKPLEMSDKDLIDAAEKTGTFEFWNNPKDDAYNTLL